MKITTRFFPGKTHINIIGEDNHGNVENEFFLKKAKILASQDKIILVREGDDYEEDENHKPIGSKGVYGIEDPLILEYGNLLLTYRKCLSVNDQTELLYISNFYTPARKKAYIATQKSLTEYLVCSVFQLFMKGDSNIQIKRAIVETIQHFEDEAQEEYKAIEFFYEELYFKYKDFFYGSFYDSDKKFPPECTTFFYEKKQLWDKILKIVIQNLLAAIIKFVEKPYRKDDILNFEILENFFKNPRESGYADKKVCGYLRSCVFAYHLKLLACNASTKKPIYFIVGQGHLEEIRQILGNQGGSIYAPILINYYSSKHKPPDMFFDDQNLVTEPESAEEQSLFTVKESSF